jgi:hypothetical protein
MARARQDRRQQAPTLLALAALLAQPVALVLSIGLVLPQALALAEPAGQVMVNGIVPRNGSSCPLVVPSQVSFLQPKRLRPEEVKAKNAAGCLSAADAIYRADGCPLKLCPNPQWQGL